jgi:two-component system, cell cycle response regulator DivK
MDVNNKTVLVVEDNDDTRLLLQQYLKSRGWRVSEAVNGEEAVERAAQDNPDLIIMDLSLPKLNGREAIRRICKIERLAETPIMIVSAHGDRAIEYFTDPEIPSGRTLYLPKPFEIDDLTQMLADLFLEDQD